MGKTFQKRERVCSAQRRRRARNEDEVRQGEKGKLSRTCWDRGWMFEAIAFKNSNKASWLLAALENGKGGSEWRVQGPVERGGARRGRAAGQPSFVSENSFTMVRAGWATLSCAKTELQLSSAVFNRTPIHHVFWNTGYDTQLFIIFLQHEYRHTAELVCLSLSPALCMTYIQHKALPWSSTGWSCRGHEPAGQWYD